MKSLDNETVSMSPSISAVILHSSTDFMLRLMPTEKKKKKEGIRSKFEKVPRYGISASCSLFTTDLHASGSGEEMLQRLITMFTLASYNTHHTDGPLLPF